MPKQNPKTFKELREIAEQAESNGIASFVQHDAESFTVSNAKGGVYVSTKGHKSLDNSFAKRVVKMMKRMGILSVVIMLVAALIYYHPFI